MPPFTWYQYKVEDYIRVQPGDDDYVNKYVVVLSYGNGTKVPDKTTTVQGTTTHDITGLTPGTDYEVFVRTTGNNNVKSNTKSFSTTDIDPPRISERTSNSITIEVPRTQPTNGKYSPLCVVADVFESSPRKYIRTESLTVNDKMTITDLLPNTDYTISVINECDGLRPLATFNVDTSILRFTNTIPDITMDEGTVRSIKLNAADYNDRDITYSVKVLNDKTLPGHARNIR